LTRKHLRSRKKLSQDVTIARTKDQEAIDIITDLGTSMLTVCQERDVEPETLLYELVLLIRTARDEMLRKYATQFSNPDGKPWTKKQKMLIYDDYDRLGNIINKQCNEALEDTDRRIRVGEAGSEEKAIGCKKNGERPYYIN
jgi:hypothetical protein